MAYGQNHLTETFSSLSYLDSQEHFSPCYKSMNPGRLTACMWASKEPLWPDRVERNA